MRAGPFTSDSGVVLLETILTLPVYLVILASLFWLGELCLTRLTLTHGERLRLWEVGNWNVHSGRKLKEVFGFLDQGTSNRSAVVTGVSDFTEDFSSHKTKSAYNWGQVIEGHAEVRVRRSEWSWGIAELAVNHLWSSNGNQEIQGASAFSINARTNNSGEELTSLGLFRTGEGAREGGSLYVNSRNWNNMYLGTWEEFVIPPERAAYDGRRAQDVTAYNRHASYVRWSN